MESRGHEGSRVFLNAGPMAPSFTLAAQAKIKSVLKKQGCIGCTESLGARFSADEKSGVNAAHLGDGEGEQGDDSAEI